MATKELKLPEILNHLEADIAKFSAVPTYILSKRFEKRTSQKARQIMGILSATNDLYFHG